MKEATQIELTKRKTRLLKLDRCNAGNRGKRGVSALEGAAGEGQLSVRMSAPKLGNCSIYGVSQLWGNLIAICPFPNGNPPQKLTNFWRNAIGNSHGLDGTAHSETARLSGRMTAHRNNGNSNDNNNSNQHWQTIETQMTVGVSSVGNQQQQTSSWLATTFQWRRGGEKRECVRRRETQFREYLCRNITALR